ncbi:MAG: class I SAM-dependent methyltransferase [Nanoarchaeota archaeon]|nr:class I SAM-dependent methyltransferase [Nanoarchaeota archaeon]
MIFLAEKIDDYLVRYLAYFNYKNYVNRLNLQSNQQILEVGSGGGNLSGFLAKKIPYGRLVCLDNSEYWIDKSRKRLKNFRNIEFNLGNILNFDKENYFDVSIIHYVLHDITNKKRAVDILNKSLKDKGLIYIREPTRKNHGMSSEEIERLMFLTGLKKLFSGEGYSFPLKGKVYESVWKKKL